MMRCRASLAVFSLTAFLTPQLQAAPAIGVASSKGAMEVNSVVVRGMTNLPEGASLRTTKTAGEVHLQNGVQATLGLRTAATVSSNKMELREGAGQILTRQGFTVDALGFEISPAAGKAITRVIYDRPGRILVTAVDAAVDVRHEGVLLTRVNPGATYFFEPEPGNTDSDGAASGGGQAGSNTVKHLSTKAKWGIFAGVAAAAGLTTGLVMALDEGEPASRR